jgi:outer membrane protein OmpA-like peptidoglycan-associated protein
MSMTSADQAALVAPTASGQTGLFNVVTGNTLHRGDFSFGIYVNGYPLEAAESPIVIPSARENRPIDYYLTRLSASVGYGLTDRWEVSAMLPYDRIHNRGDDRTGFINGFHYAGRFSESGTGPIRLATKFGLTPPDGPSHFALSLFADLPTGDHDSGISTGGTDWGVGAHYTTGQWTLGGNYKIRGSRGADDSNFPAISPASIDVPNEWTLEAGLNHPLGWWRTTNWITEATGIFYQGGDFKPDNPIFLVTGLRHWFGDSGWALSAGVRWNVAKFGRNSEECRVTELEDCSLAGLAGLTFAPLHLAPVAPPAPPPPAPVPVPPPPPPAPVTPPEPPPVTPVTPPPHTPTELRVDEIHFEPGSARLTNIAKAILDDVALRMKQEPTSTAIVIGYTDDREATGPNADLDRRRAEAVRDYLVTRHGIDASRITVEGRDAREPVGDNSTAEGRLKNRRVVIRLMLP